VLDVRFEVVVCKGCGATQLFTSKSKGLLDAVRHVTADVAPTHPFRRAGQPADAREGRSSRLDASPTRGTRGQNPVNPAQNAMLVVFAQGLLSLRKGK
jgi:hypothetical protein